jgi:two-component system, OmpR family, phosphate regulon response regulator PhoB
VKKAQILVVEDQAATSNLIKDVLTEDGYEVHTVDTLAKARESIARAQPELVVLDRTLPDGDGADFCQELRANPAAASVPVLMLTAKKAVEDKVAGLRSGADDYLTKPFSTEELVARVEALLRRSGKVAEPDTLTAGILTLNRASRKTTVKGKDVSLSAKEFDLLWFLVYRKNKVQTRDFLLQHVWGYEEGLNLTTKVVDVTLSHLREKLGEAAGMITAVRGFGYRLDA